MVRTLLKQLHQVENEGVYKTYVRVQESGTFKPRINFSRTMQREVVPWKFQPHVKRGIPLHQGPRPE